MKIPKGGKQIPLYPVASRKNRTTWRAGCGVTVTVPIPKLASAVASVALA
jgi:hypothetical protein